MPIYEYVCQQCQSEFELLVRGQESPQCPGCSGRELARQFSVPAAHTGAARQLPVCPPGPSAPSGGNCGLPQCGQGGCQML